MARNSSKGRIRHAQLQSRQLVFEQLESRRLLAADFGDAPSPYPTLLADDGARHEAVGPRLGATRTSEADGTPSVNADADPSDDGVTFGEVRVGQLDATVTVNVQNAPQGAKLDAWIDFNGDGSWGGEGERLFAALLVAEGDNALTFDVPASAQPGEAYARFRLSTDGGLGPSGAASDGEVEDYSFTISPSASSSYLFTTETTVAGNLSGTNALEAADLDGDGDIDFVASARDGGIAWYESVASGAFELHQIEPSENLYGTIHATDIDGDADIDVIASSLDGSIAVTMYLNDGSGVFSPYSIASSSKGTWNSSIGDLDGDGTPDIVTSNAAREVLLHINPGTIGGPEWTTLTIASLPNAGEFRVKIADVDSDGDLDILSTSRAENTVRWYENIETLSFVEHVVASNLHDAISIEPLDFDRDGDIDLVVGANSPTAVVWYENNGQQQFSQQLVTSTGNGYLLRVADLDGDSDFDVVTRRGDSLVWLERTDAEFIEHTVRGEGTLATTAVVVDVDGDGDLDLASGRWIDGPITWQMHEDVTVSIAGPADFATEIGETPLVFEVSRSGRLEDNLSVSFDVSGDAIFQQDYLVEGADTFSSTLGTVTFSPGQQQAEILTRAIDDNDAELLEEEVALTLRVDEQYYIDGVSSASGVIVSDESLFDYGDLPAPYPTTIIEDGASHAAPTPRLGLTRTTEIDGVASQFADGDTGDDGVVFGDLWVGRTDASVSVDVQEAPQGAKLDAWIDFNGDGSWGGAAERIAFGLDVIEGTNSLIFSVPSSANSGTVFARFRLSTEGHLGVGGAAADGEVEDYQVGIAPPRQASANLGALIDAWTDEWADRPTAVGDIDGDGDGDAVVTSQAGDIVWLMNDGEGVFQDHAVGTSVGNVWKLLAFDVDSDGHMDIVASLPDEDQIVWFENDGSQNFVLREIASNLSSAREIAVADLDNDGDLDFVAALRTELVWLENVGSQVYQSHNITNFGVSAIATGDQDGDGLIDIYYATRLWGGVSIDTKAGVLFNRGANEFENSEMLSELSDLLNGTAGEPVGIEASDLDGNGILEAVVNLGDSVWRYVFDEAAMQWQGNLITDATGIQIRDLSVGDFTGDGTPDIALADYGGDGINLFVNDGQAVFLEDVVVPAWQPRTLALIDIEGDRDLDLFVGQRRGASWIASSQDVVDVNASILSTNEDGGQPVQMHISRSGSPLTNLRVYFSISGTAASDLDFEIAGAEFEGGLGQVEFAIGESTKIIEFYPVADDAQELDESIVVSLVENQAYSIANPTAITMIVDEEPKDYGDAPANYSTELQQDGARHFPAGPTLGANRDVELDGMPSSMADSDADDGVSIMSLYPGQQNATFVVDVQNTTDGAFLEAWIDLNGDGSWHGAGERIAREIEVSDGQYSLEFDMPSWAVPGKTYARFRVSSQTGIGYSGFAADGEVEDYAITISPPATANMFGDPRHIDLGTYGTDHAIAIDFDRDGDVDILSSSEESGEAFVWNENDGTGSFTRHSIPSTTGGSYKLIAGDIDGDGDDDVLTLNNSTMVWHINNGAQQFSPHILPSSIESSGIDLADLDGDGDLDVLAASYNNDSIYWYENTGNVTFEEHLVASGVTNLVAVAVDMDSDGDLDVLAGSGLSFGSDDGIQWYENTGQQVFSPRSVSDGFDALDVFPVDLDRDGDIDVISANRTYITWHENDGAQEFTPHDIEAPGSVTRLFASDLDGDGDVDILSNAGLDTVVWHENDGENEFVERVLDTGKSVTSDVLTADLDGDSDLDVVAVNRDSQIVWFKNSYAVSISSSTQEFSEEGTEGVAVSFRLNGARNHPTEVAFEVQGTAILGVDFSLSGETTLKGTQGIITVPAGEMSATLTLGSVSDSLFELDEQISLRILNNPEYIIDGPEILFVTLLSDEFGGDFGDAPAAYPTLLLDNGAAHSQGAMDAPRLGANIDLDNDGQPSVNADGDGADDDGVTFGAMRVGALDTAIAVNIQNGPGYVDAWIDWDGDGSWSPAEQILNSEPAVEGDNFFSAAVPVWAKPGTTYARFRVSSTGGLGVTGIAADGEVEDYTVLIKPPVATTGVFDAETLLATASNVSVPNYMEAADIDNDGDLDLVSATNSAQLWWFENTGNQSYIEHEIGINGRTVTAADLDGDGDVDLVTTYNSIVAWLENDGTQDFTSHELSISLSGASSATIVDLNNDGILDIAATGTSGNIVWFENLGDGAFSEQSVGYVGGLGISPRDLVSADIDGDGDRDLIVTGDDFFGDTLWFRNDGDGVFVENYLSSFNGKRLATADFNNDGVIDVLASNGSDISLALADGDLTFTSFNIDGTNNAQTQLVVADFDGDGDIDFASGFSQFDESLVWYRNDGQANFVRQVISVTASSVLALAAGDMDGNGTIDLIASHRFPYAISLFTQPFATFVDLLSPEVTAEGGSPLTFRISVDTVLVQPLDVPFSVAGTASSDDYILAGADSFDGLAGIATIPAGSSFVDLVATPLVDSITELAETLILNGAIGVIAGDAASGDYGDAPAPYRTGPQAGGAAHIAVGPTLGATRTGETYGANSESAAGDSDDDGVTFGSVRVGQASSSVLVDVQNSSGNAYLDAWIDFNGDGSWSGPQEQIFAGLPVTPGANELLFEVPSGTRPGTTYARFRISSSGALSPTGDAVDGEVEDHQVAISPPVRGPMSYSKVILAPTDSSSSHMVSIDFDRDGDIDIVTANQTGGISWLENVSLPTMINTISHDLPSFVGSISELQIVDLDRDGDYDILAGTNSEGIAWLKNEGNGVFSSHALAPSFSSARSIFAYDVDGDGDTDLVASSFGNPSHEPGIRWLENLGDETFVVNDIVASAMYLTNLKAVDIDGNGYLDVLGYSSSTDSIEAFSFTHGSWSQRTVLSDVGELFEVADLDADGDMDILGIQNLNTAFKNLLWHENTGDGSFEQHVVSNRVYDTYFISTADIDGDGDLDALYPYAFSLYETRWYENRLVGDYNSDNQVDQGDYAYWQSHFGSTSGVGLRADGNDDGKVSLADYTVWRDNLGSQKGPRLLDPISPVPTIPEFRSLADYDNDGDLDLISFNPSGIVLHANVPTLTLETASGPIAEGGTPGSFTLTRDSEFERDLNVDLEISGVALAGVDYLIDGITMTSSSTGQFIIPAGEESITVSLLPVDDDLFELEETFGISLLASGNYVTGTSNSLSLQVISDEVGGDFGDAPSPYPTLLTADGARHSQATNNDPQLGPTREVASDATPAPNANGSSSDDGITLGQWHAGQLGAEVAVTVQGENGLLDAWIDFNNDGHFGGINERIFAHVPVSVGENLLSFDIPAAATTSSTIARFRLSSAGVSGPVGVAADGEAEDYSVLIQSPANATTTFSPAIAISNATLGPTNIYTIDLDHDGDADVVTSSQQDNQIAWHENLGPVGFVQHTIATTADNAQSVIAFDFDGDGDLDVVSASFTDDEVAWYENDGMQNFTRRVSVYGSDGANSVSAADVDGDGDLDVISTSRNDRELAWYENRGPQTPLRHIISSEIRPEDATPVDLDRDGDIDIVVASSSSNAVHWYENDGSQSFTFHAIETTLNSADSVTPVDLDGDGDIDLVAAPDSSTGLRWYENDGNQLFTTHEIAPGSLRASWVAVGDLDGDGDLDLASTAPLDNQVLWHENNGNQVYATHIVSNALNDAYRVELTDMDSDSDLDIVAVSRDDDRVVWFENHLPGDFNRDGTVDAGDYSTWKSSFGSMAAAGTLGDGNYDGIVSIADYTIWRDNLGASVPASNPSPTKAALRATPINSRPLKQSVSDPRGTAFDVAFTMISPKPAVEKQALNSDSSGMESHHEQFDQALLLLPVKRARLQSKATWRTRSNIAEDTGVLPKIVPALREYGLGKGLGFGLL